VTNFAGIKNCKESPCSLYITVRLMPRVAKLLSSPGFEYNALCLVIIIWVRCSAAEILLAAFWSRFFNGWLASGGRGAWLLFGGGDEIAVDWVEGGVLTGASSKVCL